MMLHSLKPDVEDDDVPVSSDEELVDEEKHRRLLKSIGASGGKTKKQRKQSRDVFALNPGAVRESGKPSTSFKTIKNKLKECEDPLPKHKVEAVERSIAYEGVCKELSKWDPIIKQNRRAPQLVFPAQKQSWSNNYLYRNNRTMQPRTALELELAACLAECKDHIPSRKTGLTPREQRHLKTVSQEEAKAYLSEVRKHRELLSYKEAKDKWRKKIKSKRWLKRMRKTRLEREKAELAHLEKTDRKAFMEKMAEFEKFRMQERMSLKHRGSNKFKKRQKLFGKYDEKARTDVQEMLEKSKELRKKVRVESDTEEESDEVPETPADKPPASSVYVKPVAISNKNLSEEEAETSDEETFISETLTRKRTLQEIEDEDGYVEAEAAPKSSKFSKVTERKEPPPDAPAPPELVLDMTMNAGIDLATTMDEEVTAADDSDSEIMTMEEAFAADDVKEEFAARKEEIENRDKPKDINTYLPGWGDWTGPGITISKRKLRRFTIRARKAPPGKHSGIGHVIFHKVENPEAEKHRVKSVPFPFTSVEQFERSLQQPVGRAFNTELSHKELCKPRIVTKLGAIIKPMNKEEVFSKQKQQQQQQKRKEEEQKKRKRSRKKRGTKGETKQGQAEGKK